MTIPKSALARLVHSAEKTRARGMAVTVSGPDLNAIVNDYLALLNGNGAAEREALRAAVKTADLLLTDHPALWGQPLVRAISDLHDGNPPTEIVDAVTAVCGKPKRTKARK